MIGAASGCSDLRSLAIEASFDSGLVVVVSTSGDEVDYRYFESGDLHAATFQVRDEAPVTFLLEDASFVTARGTPTTLKDVTARLDGFARPEGSCGRCSTGRSRPPWVTSPGSECEIPAEAPAFSGSSLLEPGQFQELRARVRLDWPGPCACDEAGGSLERGPIRVAEDRWPVRHALALESKETLLIGKRVVRTSSAGVTKDGPESVADRCGSEGLDAPVDHVMQLPSGRIRAYTRDQQTLELDAETLEITGRWSGPENFLYLDAVSRGSRTVFGGRADVRTTVPVATLILCDQLPTGPDCEFALKAGGSNATFSQLAAVGDGLVGLNGGFFVIVQGWPAASDVAAIVDPNVDGALALRSGERIPIWYFQAPDDYPTGSLKDVAGGPDRALLCQSRGGGLRILEAKLDIQSQSRPEISVGTSCPELDCGLGVSAFGTEAFLTQDSNGAVRALVVGPQGRAENCDGISLPGLSGVVQASGGPDHLLVVDRNRRVARLDAWDAPIEWIDPGPERVVVDLEDTPDGPFAYSIDGVIERPSPQGSEIVGQMPIEGRLMAAARSPTGQFLALSTRDQQRFIELVSDEEGSLHSKRLSEIEAKSSKPDLKGDVLWVAPELAFVAFDYRIIRVTGDEITELVLDWDDPNTPNLETPETPIINLLAGGAGGILGFNDLGRDLSDVLLIDPWSAGADARPAPVKLNPRSSNLGGVAGNIETINLEAAATQCPGVFRAGLSDRLVAELSTDDRTLEVLLTDVLAIADGYKIHGITAAPAPVEIAFLRGFGSGSGGALSVVDQPLLETDAGLTHVVSTQAGLIALGEDGRLYYSAPCP